VNVEFAKFKEHLNRYTIVSGNEILLNTKDVCRVLAINKRLPIGILRHPCMDLASIIEAALPEGKDDVEFIDCLEANFVGYEIRTPIRPNCDDDWKFE
jgi:hypothetical protein